MGAFLLSEIRDALNAYRDTVDCCIIKGASCPRAAKAYDDDAYVAISAAFWGVEPAATSSMESPSR